MAYESRFYRDWISKQGLTAFEVKFLESDLQIRARRPLPEAALKLVKSARADIESYAAREPRFYASLTPLPVKEPCPAIAREMLDAGQAWDVGPMAAVAGVVAEYVGRGLLSRSDEIIVENGGDIWLNLPRPALLAVYCGPKSPLSGRLRIRVDGGGKPLGICTSSAVVGPSLSFGKADAVVAIASTGALADAAATSICNRIRAPEDLAPVIAAEQERGRLLGLVAVIGRQLGAFGNVELETADE